MMLDQKFLRCLNSKTVEINFLSSNLDLILSAILIFTVIQKPKFSPAMHEYHLSRIDSPQNVWKSKTPENTKVNGKDLVILSHSSFFEIHMELSFINYHKLGKTIYKEL